MEIPTALKRLVRLVLRGFYNVEHTLVMDMLIRKVCVKEEDLETLLKFEKKHLRAIIAQLKNDKMIKTKLKMETGPDGKATRQNYYYINYKGFVNVVKYKLDLMRRKIETEERDSTKRASFICSSCKKTFTDLEADQLWDTASGEFKCSYCGEVVDEDPDVLPKPDSRLILAKFNEQIEPLYLLLKEVEDLKIPADLLEPEPVETATVGKINPSFSNDSFGSFEWKESEKNKLINSEYENSLFKDQSLIINIENVNGSISVLDKTNQPVKNTESNLVIKKEQPVWLTENRVFGSIHSPSYTTLSNSTKKPNEKALNNFFPSNEESSSSTKEILEALLVHERHQETSNDAAYSILSNRKDLFGNDSIENKGETIESDEDEFDDSSIPFVKVGDQLIALNDICDDHFASMNSFEKEEYIRLTQEVYAHIYE